MSTGHHFTDHCLQRMAERGISVEDVLAVLAAPISMSKQGNGRTAYWGKQPSSPEHVLCVVVEPDNIVVTTYRDRGFSP